MSIVVSRVLNASADRAWDVLVTWRRQGEWMPFTHVHSADESGLGARIEARTGVGRFQVTDPMAITEWDPPRRCVVRHEGRVIRGTGTFLLTDLGGRRCLLTWREDVAAPRPVAWLMRPFFGWALRRFARLVE